MEKVTPDLYRKYTSTEYKTEFDRIAEEIKQMNDIDFEIIYNTDIPYRIAYLRTWQRSFADIKKHSISTQKGDYIRWLENIFMFPHSMFQQN